jgi:acyl carrier protein
MTKSDAVKIEVIDMLNRFCPGTSVDMDDRFVEDLRLSSDDFTAVALRLERKFKFRADRKLWSTAFTVRDVVQLVEDHVRD